MKEGEKVVLFEKTTFVNVIVKDVKRYSIQNYLEVEHDFNGRKHTSIQEPYKLFPITKEGQARLSKSIEAEISILKLQLKFLKESM